MNDGKMQGFQLITGLASDDKPAIHGCFKFGHPEVREAQGGLEVLFLGNPEAQAVRVDPAHHRRVLAVLAGRGLRSALATLGQSGLLARSAPAIRESRPVPALRRPRYLLKVTNRLLES